MEHTYKMCKYILSYLLYAYFHCFNLIGWRATQSQNRKTLTVCPSRAQTIFHCVLVVFYVFLRSCVPYVDIAVALPCFEKMYTCFVQIQRTTTGSKLYVYIFFLSFLLRLLLYYSNAKNTQWMTRRRYNLSNVFWSQCNKFQSELVTPPFKIGCHNSYFPLQILLRKNDRIEIVAIAAIAIDQQLLNKSWFNENNVKRILNSQFH